MTAVILLLLHTVVMLSDKTTGEIPIIAHILFLKEKFFFKDVWLDGHVWLCLILDVTECVKDWNSHICMVNLEKKAKFKHSSVKLLSLNLTATCSGTP